MVTPEDATTTLRRDIKSYKQGGEMPGQISVGLINSLIKSFAGFPENREHSGKLIQDSLYDFTRELFEYGLRAEEVLNFFAFIARRNQLSVFNRSEVLREDVINWVDVGYDKSKAREAMHDDVEKDIEELVLKLQTKYGKKLDWVNERHLILDHIADIASGLLYADDSAKAEEEAPLT
jgi:hypothetical protein